MTRIDDHTSPLNRLGDRLPLTADKREVSSRLAGPGPKWAIGIFGYCMKSVSTQNRMEFVLPPRFSNTVKENLRGYDYGAEWISLELWPISQRESHTGPLNFCN